MFDIETRKNYLSFWTQKVWFLKLYLKGYKLPQTNRIALAMIQVDAKSQQQNLPTFASLISVSLSPSAGYCLRHGQWSEHEDEDTFFQLCPRLRLMLIVIGVIYDQTPSMLALASPWETSRMMQANARLIVWILQESGPFWELQSTSVLLEEKCAFTCAFKMC